ncbi:MAG: hypothetical protein VYC34_07350 [Planctomycetota bacterium]|nr:hypothetical protein [Planctomycetota bacterium]
MRHSRFVSCFAGVLGLSAAADAGIVKDLVRTASPSRFGTFETARVNTSVQNPIATNLVQEFTLSGAFFIESISIFGSGIDLDLYIVDSIGPGATEPENIVWSAHDIEAPGVRAWQEVEAGGFLLGPGDYFLVLASDHPSGARWSYVSTLDPEETLNVGDDGIGTYKRGDGEQRAASIDYVFDRGDSQAFATRITGIEIPAPAVVSIAALALAPRRRRAG